MKIGWLRLGEKTDEIICHFDCKHLYQRLLPAIHLSDKESINVSTVILANTLRKKGEIKTA